MSGGTPTVENDAVVVFAHIPPAGPLAPTPALSKLVRLGARCSEARCPGGDPAEVFGVLGAPIVTCILTFQRSSFLRLPEKFILTVSRPGPAVRVLFAK